MNWKYIYCYYYIIYIDNYACTNWEIMIDTINTMADKGKLKFYIKYSVNTFSSYS